MHLSDITSLSAQVVLQAPGTSGTKACRFGLMVKWPMQPCSGGRVPSKSYFEFVQIAVLDNALALQPSDYDPCSDANLVCKCSYSLVTAQPREFLVVRRRNQERCSEVVGIVFARIVLVVDVDVRLLLAVVEDVAGFMKE